MQQLNVDLRPTGPNIKQFESPWCYADPTVRVAPHEHTGEPVYYDIWGVGFIEKEALGAKYLDLAVNPLANLNEMEALDDYPFPDVDLWNYSGIPAQIEKNREYCIWAHSRGFFEISWFMRGMDSFLLDLMLRTEYAYKLMDRIVEYLTERTLRILDSAGKSNVDIVEINDDVGGQNGLLISPEVWRKAIKPRMKRMIKTFKQHGVYIRYHSCGGVREIIPDLIEIGVDILNPVQPLARGMNLDELKQEFGDRITFNGGIDTQDLLPHLRGEQFEREVRRILEMMSRGGGFIMAPAHALQADVPLENILRLYEIAAEQVVR